MSLTIREIFVLAITLLTAFNLGVFICEKIKCNNNLITLPLGFFGFLALFHIFSLPFIYFKTSFKYPLLILLILIFLINVLTLLLSGKAIVKRMKALLVNPWFYLMILLAIGLYIYAFDNVFFEYDAKFFVPNIVEMLDNHSGIYTRHPETGQLGFKNWTYRYISYDVWIGLSSYLSATSVRLYLVVIMPIYTFVNYTFVIGALLSEIFKKKSHFILSIVLIALFTMFLYRPHFFFPAEMIDSFPYIGKGMFFLNGIPLICFLLYKYYEKREINYLLLLIIPTIAGLAMSASALFSLIYLYLALIIYTVFFDTDHCFEVINALLFVFIPIYHFAPIAILGQVFRMQESYLIALFASVILCLFAWMIYRFNNQRKSQRLLLMIYRSIIIGFFLLMVGYTLYSVSFDLIRLAGFYNIDDMMKCIVQAKYTYIIYLLTGIFACISLFSVSDKPFNKVFVIIPVIMLLYFFTPLTVGFVTTYISDIYTYHRGFYTIKLDYALPIILTILMVKNKRYLVLGTAVVVLLFFNIRGINLDRTPKVDEGIYAELYDQKYRLPQVSVELGRYFDSYGRRVEVLSYDYYIRDMRQVTPRVVYAVDPRAASFSEYGSKDSTLYKVMILFEGSDLTNKQYLQQYLNELQKEFVIVTSDVYKNLEAEFKLAGYVFPDNFEPAYYTILQNKQYIKAEGEI